MSESDNQIADVDEDFESTQGKLTLKRASQLLTTFWSMAYPYYAESQPGRRLFYGMILLTLMNSGVSVAFSYVSKDFWNALNNKDVGEFYEMMVKFGGALVVGAPVAVLYRLVVMRGLKCLVCANDVGLNNLCLFYNPSKLAQIPERTTCRALEGMDDRSNTATVQFQQSLLRIGTRCILFLGEIYH
jgi:hypothetical protein